MRLRKFILLKSLINIPECVKFESGHSRATNEFLSFVWPKERNQSNARKGRPQPR